MVSRRYVSRQEQEANLGVNGSMRVIMCVLCTPYTQGWLGDDRASEVSFVIVTHTSDASLTIWNDLRRHPLFSVRKKGMSISKGSRGKSFSHLPKDKCTVGRALCSLINDN